MTALNTPVNQGQAGQDFRRGLLIGAAATALLAASMAAAAFGSGAIGTSVSDAAAPAIQAPAMRADPGLAPRTEALPAVEPYLDYGQRHAPAVEFEPYLDYGQRHAPAPAINESNPHENGPIQAW